MDAAFVGLMPLLDNTLADAVSTVIHEPSAIVPDSVFMHDYVPSPSIALPTTPTHLKQFHCEECTYTTNDRSHFKRHMKVHNKDLVPVPIGEPLLEVRNTMDGSGVTPDIVVPMPVPAKRGGRRSSGDPGEEKRHRCDFEACSYSTSDKSHLNRHRRIHTGEKPFKCTYEGCTFASAQSSDVTVHMRGHSGERPYSCSAPGCDYKSARNSRVHVHINAAHKGDPSVYVISSINSAFSRPHVTRRNASLRTTALQPGVAVAPHMLPPNPGAASDVVAMLVEVPLPAAVAGVPDVLVTNI